MSILWLVLFLFWQNAAGAMPVLFFRDDPMSATDDIPSRRSMFTIIWACWSTTFLCAWVSIHPNVPPTNEGFCKALARRLTLMFWTIVAPELILAWAVRQWFAAGKIAEAYNEARGQADPKSQKKWTRVHGHLVIMGGIHLVDLPEEADQHAPEPRLLGFDPDLVQHLAKHDEFLDITEADINDKSKRDSLAKALAIIQTTWFIVQCITRGVQRVALTELELVTLALASLNGITFAFWWKKPLDVKVPIRVRLKHRLPSQNKGSEKKRTSSEAAHAFSIAKKAGEKLRDGIFKIMGGSCDNPFKAIFSWFILLPICLSLLFLLPVFTLVLLIYAYLFDIVDTHDIPDNDQHVPMFYAPKTASDSYSRMLVFAFFGVLFGGLHCIGWNFDYPTGAERQLWRVTSITITGIPLVVAPIDFIITSREFIFRDVKGFERFVRGVLIFLLVSLLFVYVPVRLSLVGQALALLRKQPPSAFYVVEWTKLFPHFR